MAVILSLCAGLISVFTVYKVSSVKQQVGALYQSVANQQKAQSNPTQGGTVEIIPPQNTVSTASNTSPPPTNVTGIQPGQFVQPALRNEAEVTLLTVKRIQDPDTATRDVVNVQLRVRRIGEAGTSVILPAEATARNPDTGETYKIHSQERATRAIILLTVKKGASVDAYVWLRVPEGVNTLDI